MESRPWTNCSARTSVSWSEPNLTRTPGAYLEMSLFPLRIKTFQGQNLLFVGGDEGKSTSEAEASYEWTTSRN